MCFHGPTAFCHSLRTVPHLNCCTVATRKIEELPRYINLHSEEIELNDYIFLDRTSATHFQCVQECYDVVTDLKRVTYTYLREGVT